VVKVTAVVVAALVSSACSGSGSSERLTVAAAFGPLAEVARAVGGDRVEVITLTAPGEDPHGLDALAVPEAQARAADVLVYLGLGFQPAVETLAARFAGTAVDGLRGLPVVDDDPHVWLDASMLERIVIATQRALAAADPDHAGDYAANGLRYRRSLLALDRRLATGLADCDRNVVVSAHAAWRYFTSRYRLEQEPVAGVAPGDTPSDDRLRRLAALIRDAGVTTIFPEPHGRDAQIAALAAFTGVRTAELDPVERPGRSYVERMERNMRVLRTALGCR
jgi:zinc transport system substrate-binding protein